MKQAAVSLLALMALACPVSIVAAQAPAAGVKPAPAGSAPARAADDDPSQLLGERYVSRAAGISLRPPTGGKEQRTLGIGSGTPFVTFWSESDRWTLKVLQIVSPVPTTLMSEPARPETPGQAARPATTGLVDEMERGLLRNNSAAQILRKDLINIGRYDTGVLVSRYTTGAQTWLHQQAIIQESDVHFYVLDFTTPSGRTISDPPGSVDTAERIAAGLFDAILQTVQVIDTRPVQRELEARAYANLAFQVNMPGRIERLLVPDHYARIVLKGKDVGWIYTTEKFGEHNGVHGFLVTTLTHRQDSATSPQLDIASEMFTNLDRSDPQEAWVTINKSTLNGRQEHSEEYGQSMRSVRKIPVEVVPEDPRQRRYTELRSVNEYKLTVTQNSQAGSKTVDRDLMSYYLSRAAGAILPRILPQHEKKGYAFPTWVSSEKQVIWRYVDVEGERQVKLNGKTVDAWVVRDSISLEGDPTYHYFAANGAWLGSETPASGVVILPTDEQTIRQKYPKAEIGRPNILEGPNVPRPGAPARPVVPEGVLPGSPGGR